MNETLLTIIFGVLAVIGYFLSYYFHIKAKIYAATEKAVDEAEQDDKVAAEKMELAVNQIYDLIPAILKPLFSKEVIKGIVQNAFNSIESYAKKQIEKKG